MAHDLPTCVPRIPGGCEVDKCGKGMVFLQLISYGALRKLRHLNFLSRTRIKTECGVLADLN